MFFEFPYRKLGCHVVSQGRPSSGRANGPTSRRSTSRIGRPTPGQSAELLLRLGVHFLSLYIKRCGCWPIINSAVHSSAGLSPTRHFLGREVNTPLLLRWDISCSDHQNETAQTDIWKQALEILKAALSQMKCQYDSTHAKKHCLIYEGVHENIPIIVGGMFYYLPQMLLWAFNLELRGGVVCGLGEVNDGIYSSSASGSIFEYSNTKLPDGRLRGGGGVRPIRDPVRDHGLLPSLTLNYLKQQVWYKRSRHSASNSTRALWWRRVQIRRAAPMPLTLHLGEPIKCPDHRIGSADYCEIGLVTYYPFIPSIQKRNDFLSSMKRFSERGVFQSNAVIPGLIPGPSWGHRLKTWKAIMREGSARLIRATGREEWKIALHPTRAMMTRLKVESAEKPTLKAVSHDRSTRRTDHRPSGQTSSLAMISWRARRRIANCGNDLRLFRTVCASLWVDASPGLVSLQDKYLILG
ncbi:unnamed protein product [Nesidiocoris tenuis]|uniref:Uncharacterized protein n=1 Tax=Nesidiocoris tenuis TaxID=355587 RepID=A0A6H5H816_9HEMI|nr:unnamed protein product [Nesidiocoris tenuis]